MSDEVLAYLLDRQRIEAVPAFVMAARIGLGEGNWCHVRKGRRRLTIAQIERAIALYPELRERLAEAVA